MDHLTSNSTRATRSNSSVLPLRILSTKKNTYKYSLYPRTAPEWNLLPDHIKSATTLDEFKDSLKEVNIATLIKDAHYDD